MGPKREQASSPSSSSLRNTSSNHIPTGSAAQLSGEQAIVHGLDTYTLEDDEQQESSELDVSLISAQMDGSPSTVDLDIPKLSIIQDPLALSKLNTKLEMLLRDGSNQSIIVFQQLADLCRDGASIAT